MTALQDMTALRKRECPGFPFKYADPGTWRVEEVNAKRGLEKIYL